MLDFTIEDATAEEAARPSVYETSPLRDALADSWDAGSEDGDFAPKKVTVSNDDVSKLRSQLSGCATHLGIGVRVVVRDNGDDTSTVVFTAKERTERPRKAK